MMVLVMKSDASTKQPSVYEPLLVLSPLRLTRRIVISAVFSPCTLAPTLPSENQVEGHS